MMAPRVVFDFPVTPWYPGDPIIRDGIEFVIGDLGRFTAYGGGENYRDTALARSLAASHDALLVAGTPAFWDANDRDIFRSAIERDLPIVIWGVGSGGGDRPWEGFAQDTELLHRLATYPRLEALLLRDEATHQFFRMRGAAHGEIVICPGFFALPSPRLRTARNVVALDLLDPRTVEKDGLYESWRYYASMVEIAAALQARGAEIRLVCQRAIFDHGFKDTSRDPHSWCDASGLGLIDWLDAVAMPRDLVDGLRDLPNREAFVDFYGDCDVYIGARIHGALPCAGSGMPTIAIGIDLRRGTWLPAGESVVAVPHQPPAIDIDFILAWYDRLEPEAVSGNALRQRQYWLDRTRTRLSETVLAPLVPAPAPRYAPLSPFVLERLRAATEPPEVLARLPEAVRAYRILKRARDRLAAVHLRPLGDQAVDLFRETIDAWSEIAGSNPARPVVARAEGADFLFDRLAASLEAGGTATELVAPLRPHVVYALQRLAGVAQPTFFGAIEPLPNAFRKGSGEFDRMVAEAAANFIAVLVEDAERRQRR
ncbi:MAG TPA: polysaccharide pyruvyl transferase family protein [Stellaceae bacterium]|nr:polysaccharide pyruvyl transferase family protein [Stellaceae bacterium]